MSFALLHPGDLSLGWLLLALLLVVGVPALLIAALAYAVYRGLSPGRAAPSIIRTEEERGTTAASGGRADGA